MNPEYRKAEALLAMGRSQEAANLLDQLPGREVPDVEFYRLRGRTFRAAGRVFDAEAAFREALALSPSDPSLLADLATTLLGQRRLKEALPYAREAVSIRPDQAAFHCLVAVIAEALDLDREARDALSHARRLTPGDPEPHTLYGFLLLRSHEIDDAEGAFYEALAADPSRSEALRGLARCRAARKDWGGARSRWLEALALAPTSRDPILDRLQWLGHPALAPARAIAWVHPTVSIALLLGSGAWFWLNPLSMVLPAMLCIAATPPLTRVLLSRGFRE